MSQSQSPSEALLAQAAAGYRTTLVTQAVRLACKFVSTVVMARLVAPDGFGDFAMAASIFWLLALFRDAGMGTAAVQAKTISDRQSTALFWVHLTIGFALTVVAASAAPLAGMLFQSDRVVSLLRVMSLAFAVIGAGGFIRSWLIRQMRMNELNRLEAWSAAVATLAMIIAAAMGAGAYAFVVFLFVSEVITTVLAWRIAHWSPRGRPAWESLNGLWRTGWHVTAQQVLVFLSGHLDTIAVGRWFGAHVVGLYNRSGQLLTLPTQYVAGPLGQVLMATLSRMHGSREQYLAHAWSTITSVAHLVLPVYAICLALPGPVLGTVLGADWLPASPYFQALAAVGVALALVTIAQALTIAAGNSHRLIGSAAAPLPVIILVITIRAQHGPEGVAIGMALSHVALLIPRLWWLLRDLPQGLKQFGAALLGPVVGSTAIGGGSYLGGAVLAANSGDIPQLLLGIGIAGAAVGLISAAWPRLRHELSGAAGFIAGRTHSEARR